MSRAHPSSSTQMVRREVWRRDQGQCAFVGVRGRCAERGFLEFHHVEPCAEGGAADAGNIELRCRAHNQYEADLFFGADVVKELELVWDGQRWREGQTRVLASRGHAGKAPRSCVG